MISAAVQELQAAKKEIATQIKDLETEAKKIDNAIHALSGLSVGGKSAANKPGKQRKKMSAAGRKAIAAAKKKWWADQKAGKAKGATPVKKQKMSRLGKLRIKFGALRRYGKKDEAKKVQAQIATLEAKAAKKQ